MGFYLLNISVDSPDIHPEYIPEDLTINDLESVIEIVFEQVLGFEDTFKEYDDHDTEDHNNKTNTKIDLTTHNTNELFSSQKSIITARKKFSDYNTILTKGFQKLNIPPPKV